MDFAKLFHRSRSKNFARACSGSSVGIKQQTSVLVGYEKSRRDCVATNAAGCKMHGKPLGKIAYACFRSRVGRNFCQRTESVHGRNVDNVAARVNHCLRKYLRYKESRRDVEVKHKLKSAFVQREKVLCACKVGRHGFVVRRRLGVVAACAVDK